MSKVLTIFVYFYISLFDICQAASLNCTFNNSFAGGEIFSYYCSALSSVNITLISEAYIDSITGTHISGHNNDNVDMFSIYNQIIYYFPRGLNTFFKNLKFLHINAGLKEIHQADLKVFPKLTRLYLYGNDIEILEEGLFDFNLILELIHLDYNKILHVSSKVFDNLVNLSTLFIDSNNCTLSKNENMYAIYNPYLVRIFADKAYEYCIYPDYSNLEQKVKNLKTQSKEMNSLVLKQNIENLDTEIKFSKFPNFFQENLKNLRDILYKKSQDEIYLIFETKYEDFMKSLINLITKTSNRTDNSTFNNTDLVLQLEKLYLPLNASFSNLTENFDKLGKIFNDKTSQLINDVTKINQNYANLNENIDMRLDIIDEDLNDLETFSDNKFVKIENEAKAGHFEAVNANKAIDRVEKNVLAKIDKIMKALNVKT